VELLSDWGLLNQVTRSILESTAVASDTIDDDDADDHDHVVMMMRMIMVTMMH
jgi:hypothetical protein